MALDTNIALIIGWVLTIAGLFFIWRTSRHQIPALDLAALKDALDTIEKYSKEVKGLKQDALNDKTVYNIKILELNDQINVVNKIVKDQSGLIYSLGGQLKDEKAKYDLEILALNNKIDNLEKVMKNQDETINSLRLELIKEKQARQKLEKVIIKFQEWATRNQKELDKACIEKIPDEVMLYT